MIVLYMYISLLLMAIAFIATLLILGFSVINIFRNIKNYYDDPLSSYWRLFYSVEPVDLENFINISKNFPEELDKTGDIRIRTNRVELFSSHGSGEWIWIYDENKWIYEDPILKKYIKNAIKKFFLDYYQQKKENEKKKYDHNKELVNDWLEKKRKELKLEN